VTKSQNKARAHRGGIETELKLSFPPEAAGRLTDHPALKPPCAGPPRSVHLVSTYFDTRVANLPDGALVCEFAPMGHVIRPSKRAPRNRVLPARQCLAANGNGR
jgi:hypothetical protein